MTPVFRVRDPELFDWRAKLRYAFACFGYACAVVAMLHNAGCAGSLESARKSGTSERKLGTMAAPAGTPERCATLDDRRTFWGAAAKGSAVLAGGSGVSSIVLDDPDQKDLRTGVAIAGVAMAAIAAGSMFVAEASGDAWARECASQPASAE